MINDVHELKCWNLFKCPLNQLKITQFVTKADRYLGGRRSHLGRRGGSLVRSGWVGVSGRLTASKFPSEFKWGWPAWWDRTHRREFQREPFSSMKVVGLDLRTMCCGCDRGDANLCLQTGRLVQTHSPWVRVVRLPLQHRSVYSFTPFLE